MDNFPDLVKGSKVVVNSGYILYKGEVTSVYEHGADVNCGDFPYLRIKPFARLDVYLMPDEKARLVKDTTDQIESLKYRLARYTEGI